MKTNLCILAALIAALAACLIALFILWPEERELPIQPPPPPGTEPLRKPGSDAVPGAAPAASSPSAAEPPASGRPPKPALAGETRRRISGRVVDAAGAPMPGVDVVVALPWPTTGRPPDLCDAFDMIQKNVPESWPRGSTAEDGTFVLEAPRLGRCLLLAGPPSFKEVWAEVEVRADSDPPPAVLVLEKGFAVEGRVVDGLSGQGIEGIEISARQESEVPGQGSLTRRRDSSSGPFGMFTIEGLGPGEASFELRKLPGRGYVDAGSGFKAQAGTRDFRIELFPLGAVEFRATREDTGEPLDAWIIQVRVERSPDPSRVPALGDPPGPWLFPCSVSREAPGKFLLEAIAGSRDYVFETEGFCPVRARFEVEPRERTVRGEPVVFSRGAWIEGPLSFETPQDPHEAKPTKGAFLYTEKLGVPQPALRLTRLPATEAAPEKYWIAGLEPGLYRLTALAPGFRPVQADVEARPGGTTWGISFHRRKAGDRPSLQPRFPFKERRSLPMDLDVKDLPLGETIEWISAVSGVGLHLRPDVEAEAGKDEMSVQLMVAAIPLKELVWLLLSFKGLALNEETGEIYQRD